MSARALLEATWLGLRNTFLGTNVASLSLLSRPESMLRYVANSLFTFQAMSGRRRLPQRNVFEIFEAQGESSIKLGILDSPSHWYSAESFYTQDLVSLCLLCQILKPRRVFEIGTLTGYTAYHFALNTSDSAKVYSLDLPTGQTETALASTMIDQAHLRSKGKPNYVFAGTPAESKIELLFGDSATFDFSPYRDSIDLFFIDGAHSYEYVRTDTENAFKCCKTGGVIAWHDYGKASVPGVSRYLQELAKEREIFSIPGGSVAFLEVKS